MSAAIQSLLVLAVWAGASTAVLAGLRNLAAGGAALAAAASAGLLAVHGDVLAGALLGAGGIAAAAWLRPPAVRAAALLPPGSAPLITLSVVVGVLAVWIGGAVLAGPSGAAGRAAALVLIGLGTCRLVGSADFQALSRAALLLALGLGLVAGLEPVAISVHAPVLAVAVAAVVTAVMTFGRAGLAPRVAPLWAASLAGLAVLVLAPSLPILALVPLFVAFVELRAEGGSTCLRTSALAAGLLGVAALAAAPAGGDRIERLAGLAAALAAAAAAGLLPHLTELEDSEAGRAAYLRRALLAPAFVLAVAAQLQGALGPVPVRAFGGTLLGIGSLNVVAGLAGGFAANRLRAWQAGYLAEWGLVFVSLGLLNTTGAAAAYLLLLALLLQRLPPAWWLAAGAEPPKRGRARAVLLALAFAGGPPFAGFAARVLLLRGATALAWPFALAAGIALALALPGAWRLAESLRQPRGRLADATQLAALVVTAAVGIYPAAVLRPVGLG